MNMVKIHELEGAALDWAVMKAIGQKYMGELTRPSTNWGQCGPLIEFYKVDFRHYKNGKVGAKCTNPDDLIQMYPAKGCDYLIAACRAIVAGELGGMVEIPDELA